MRRASILHAALLAVAILLKSASGSPITRANPQPVVTLAHVIEGLLHLVQDGMNYLHEASVCDHLQTVLSSLSDLGKITLSTSGPPEPDQSLLNHPEFWEVDTVQPSADPFLNSQFLDSVSTETQNPIFFAVPKQHEVLGLTETLFPDMSSTLPQNRILNITFDCNTKQLDLHIAISDEVEGIPRFLSFSNLVLSVRVTMDAQPIYTAKILSADTHLFSIAAFVALKITKKVEIKVIPKDTSSVSIHNALEAVSGTSLPVPPGLDTLSEITFNGKVKNHTITIAMEGKSNENTVSVILQMSTSGLESSAALIADIRNIHLADFVKTVMNVDIIGIPIFGTLIINELSFAAATHEITSDLLPTLYIPGSPLEGFNTILPGGVSAYFTVDVAGMSVNAAFSKNNISFTLPSTSPLVVEDLLKQIPNPNLNLPTELVAKILNLRLSAFTFVPHIRELDLSLMAPTPSDIPNMLKLTLQHTYNVVVSPIKSINFYHQVDVKDLLESDAVEMVVGFIQDGMNYLHEASVCDHLQTVLSSLSDLGKITLSTSGPPEPDQSLLNHPEFWEVDTVQHAPDSLSNPQFLRYLNSMTADAQSNYYERSAHMVTDSVVDTNTPNGPESFPTFPKKRYAYTQEDPIFYIAPKSGETLSLTQTLFPDVSSSLPQNRILNITFDCNTKQLDLHIEISDEVEVIPGVVNFNDVVLSLRVTMDAKPNFTGFILSADTELFSIATFVAVQYIFATKMIAIKGIPTGISSLNIHNAIEAVSETSLPVPSGLKTLSEVIFNGRGKKGAITLAMEGKSNENTVSVILQTLGPNISAALIADIHNFNLASFVNTALGVDITDIPLFGTLTIHELGFSGATHEITSDLLPTLYVPGSPLEAFGITLPRGVSAYFTVDVAGVIVNAAFSKNKISFSVPSTSSLSVKQLMDQIPNLNVLNSLPKVVAEIFSIQLSGFNFYPQTKQLDIGFIMPELTVIPNILKLTNVNFTLSAIIGQSAYIQTLKITGTWSFQTVSLTTHINYDREMNTFQVKANPKGSNTALSIDTLLKNVAGNVDLPSALTSLSLTSIVGNIYNNGNYFIAMSGSASGGNLYLILYKGAEGAKTGIVASLESFQFSNLVQSTVGVDITSVPYFGDLVIPAMALAITSGEIKSPALSHLFGEESPLLAYGDTLPAGVTSRFDLDIGAVKGAVAEFYNGMLAFQLPESVDFSLQNLASEIPGISDALQALPPQISSILSAKISSFAFNSTSKDLTIMASLNTLTLVSGFLSISDISLYYDGRLDKTLTTRTLDFTGTWQIGDYAILTSVLFDGASKELTIESQSNGRKDLSISNVVQSLAGTQLQIPAAISSFTFTGITGKLADDITVVILNGIIGSGKISTVIQKTSSESDGAVVVDIANFQLVELVKSATGIDISGIPFFGTLKIPELKFAAATDNITTPLLEELAGSGTALEWFKTGIVKGVSGRFVIQIGDTSKIAANIAGRKLDFKVPDTSSLSLNDVVSIIPDIRDILKILPSQLSSVFDTQIATFSYDPVSTELQFSGSLDSTVDIVPEFVSLSNVQISLIIVLGEEKRVESLDFSGDWNLKDLPIRTTVSYNRAENRLDIVGELDEANSGVSVPELITSLSGESLSIPSVLSSVKLSKLSGNKIDDVTLVTLSGSVSEGHIFIIYQKSPSGSAVAFAADTPKFRLSSLVSSATGIDISSVPFFGTLIIPQIGFTVSSAHISNPLLLDLYPPTSPLAEFGSSIDEGITASFNVSVGDVEGIVADFAKGELDLEVPDSVDLSLIGILELIPGLQGMIDSLPQTIQDIGSTKLHKLYFIPTTSELRLRGSLDSLAIIPDFLSLQNIDFEFAGTIGSNSSVKFVKFKGDWFFNSLGLTTNVFYEKKMLLFSGAPTEDKTLNIKDFIMGLSGTKLNVPSVLDALKFTGVIGKIQDGTFSVVFMGEIGTKANVSIVYEQSTNEKIVAFAADIQEFQLSELVQAATEIDITDIPFFGTLTIPAISFVVSSNDFMTANLPDINVPGVYVPKELLLESIPAGIKGQFILDIGSALGVNADFFDNILTIEVPSSVSFSLQSLLEVIPDIKSTIDSLPSTVQDILNAKIIKLVFKPATKDLFVSLQLDSLTLVPDILLIQELQISLDAELQAVTINTLDIVGTWVLGGIEIETTVIYDKQLQLFNIVGIANGGSGVSIADIIQVFSSSSLPVPSVLSSLNLNKVVATSSNEITTVVLTATAGSANVYVLYQKTPSASAIAIAAEIHAFKIVDLIETATGIDLSGTPFISSFVISTMAFTASTNPITTPLLAETFNHDGPLQVYGDTLPKGVTAEFEVQIGGKTGIAVTYGDGQLEFVVPSNVSLSLNDLLSQIPDIASVVRDLPSPISDLLSTSIQALDFDATTKTLSVAASLNQLIIIPQIMEVKDLEVEFVAILSSNNGGLQSLDFSADWVLGDATIRIKVMYDKDSGQVFFAAMPKEGLSIQQLVSGLTGVDIPLPSAINSVQLTKIVGRKTPSMFTMIFSGTIANKADVHLVYQNMVSSSHIAIAAGIESFTFSELIESAVKIDISNVPFFGTFSVPFLALSVARGQITTDLLADVIPANSPLIKYGNTIPDGFTAKFDAPIGNINGIIGSYSDSVLTFTVPPNVDASLGSLISLIPGIDVNSIGIGSLFEDILSIQMRSFTFDAPKKEMDIEMYLEKITFFEDILAIKDAQLKLSASFSNSIRVDAEASGTIALGDMDYAVSIGRDAATNKYAITVETDNLPIFGLVTAISATFLPDDLQLILESALQFNIRDAKVVYPFGVEPQQIQLSGTPEIFGQTTAHMTAVAIKYGGKIRLISKYDFGSFNIADLIDKLVGVSLHSLKMLDQTVDIDVVLSPQSIRGVKLSIPEFAGYSLDQGISIRAPLDWPSDCSSDPFCNVAYNLLGGIELSLEGTIANAKSFSLTATIGNVELGGGVVLKHAGLQFEAGADLSVGVVGSIELSDPEITLNAAIRATFSGVKLEGSMSGCWYNAFGSPYLTICNLLLAMTIVPAPLPISGLEFGGRVELGKQSCGHVVTAEAYVGINVVNPMDDYFYADVGPVTFQSFFDAFCLDVDLPKPLGDSGFPNGFKTSFSLLGAELPHAGISIPPGFRLKGTLNFLGLEAYADIDIQLPTKFIVKINLPPITLADVFKMYRSSSDKSAGPYVDAEITTKQAPHIEASGFVEVFGISIEARLLINSSKYELELTGKFLELFEAHLLISAAYSKSITSGSFLVEGWFKNDLFDKIAEAVRNALSESADEADKYIKSAENAIRAEQAKFDSANADLEDAKRDVDSAQGAFDDAVDAVRSAQSDVDSVCSYSDCGSVCVPCPSGWGCCGRVPVLGTCICTYPEFDDCCTHVDDPICVTENGACAALKEPAKAVLELAAAAVDGSRVTLEVAKAALSAAQGVVTAARGTLDIAIAGLTAVRKTYRAGVEAISALANFALTEIINIREMYFKVALSVANGGVFQCRVKGVLMGNDIDLDLEFDIKNPLDLAKSLGEKAISGISNFFSGIFG